MKKTVCLIVVFICILLLGSCGKQETNKSSEPPITVTEVPKSTLSFELSTWVVPERKNIFSTKDNMIYKDLGNEVTSTQWNISNQDRYEIEMLIRNYDANHIQEACEKYMAEKDVIMMVQPECPIEFVYQLDGEEHSCKITNSVLAQIREEQKQTKACPQYYIDEFFSKLYEILYRQDAYTKLPEVKDGYQ